MTEHEKQTIRFEALCTIRNQLPENVRRSRKKPAIAIKHIFVATAYLFVDSKILMKVLKLNRTGFYNYRKNIENGHFAAEINKYKNISNNR